MTVWSRSAGGDEPDDAEALTGVHLDFVGRHVSRI